MNTATRTLLSLQSCEFSPDGTAQAGNKPHKLSDEIQKLRRRLSIQILHEYDLRKQHFGGESVVAVEHGLCTGCHVRVSQRTTRLAQERLTECEHCGRLLFSNARRKRIHLEICAA
jgi:predicted  nucleic acid-binding Zn-ribbon protein